MRNKNRILLNIAIFVLLLAGCDSKSELYLVENDSGLTQRELAESQSGQEELTCETEIPEVCYVYLCGAVEKPGVYALPIGSRIFEAIGMAGGLKEDADETFINQAALVTDGMMIQIYTREETAKAEATQTGKKQDDGRVNINTADITELMTLPGIGRTKAEAILAYRSEQGSFTVIEDLMQVSGIKEGTFLQVKEHIKVKND